MHAADSGATLAPIGWDDARARELAGLWRPGAIPARVARVDRGGAVAIGTDGPMRLAAAGLVAGDWVAVEAGAVAAVLERRGLVTRRAAGRADAAQAVAANVDVVLAVHGLDRPLRERRLHRAAALAWEAGARPAVVLTKADLPGAAEVEGRLFTALPGVDVLATSTRTGAGLDALRALVGPGRTAVLLGESGAGKSSLVNALAGDDALEVGAVRAGDAKGRHTTTARHLIALPGGGAIIDTPGVRELGLWGGEEGVSAAFADIEDLAGGCRFGDCRHDTEPGCAVRAAADEGRLDPARLDSFRGLAREIQALNLRADERAHRAHGRQGARLAREAQRHKRGRGG